MRSVRPVAVALASLAVAACASTSAGWTYAPAPPPTPVPSTSASAEPSPSGGTAGGVQIVAANIAFDPSAVSAPADEAFQLSFVNNDSSIPHDVVIKDGSGAEVFKTDVFPGVETRTYDVPALAAGDYPFVCSVHPNMTGTLTAG